MLDPKINTTGLKIESNEKMKGNNIQFLYFFSDKTHLLTNRKKNITQPILTNMGQFSLSSGDSNGFLCDWHTSDI